MDDLLFRGIYTVLILFQDLVQAKFFDKKDFIVTIISFIQHSLVERFNFHL